MPFTFASSPTPFVALPHSIWVSRSIGASAGVHAATPLEVDLEQVLTPDKDGGFRRLKRFPSEPAPVTQRVATAIPRNAAIITMIEENHGGPAEPVDLAGTEVVG
jgi:hypothetical protein